MTEENQHGLKNAQPNLKFVAVGLILVLLAGIPGMAFGLYLKESRIRISANESRFRFNVPDRILGARLIKAGVVSMFLLGFYGCFSHFSFRYPGTH